MEDFLFPGLFLSVPLSRHKECNMICEIKCSIWCALIKNHQQLRLRQSWSMVHRHHRLRLGCNSQLFACPQSFFSFFAFLSRSEHTSFMITWNNPLYFHPATSVFLTPTCNSSTLRIQYSVSIVSHTQSRRTFAFFWDNSFVFNIAIFPPLDLSDSYGHWDMQR